jgi:SPP1 family predicted phage head-tail adaptor
MTLYKINAGKYRHIVTFQRLTNNQNTYGETATNLDVNWENAFTARVGIFPISGKDILTDEVKNGEITHKILMRYTKNVDSSMRIKFGNRIFEITSPPINFQEMNIEMQLLCREIVTKEVGV